MDKFTELLSGHRIILIAIVSLVGLVAGRLSLSTSSLFEGRKVTVNRARPLEPRQPRGLRLFSDLGRDVIKT
jgi:hypothetical protein